MWPVIGLAAVFALTAGVSSGLAAQLGTGPESIMRLSGNETTVYSSLDENSYLSLTRLQSALPNLESDSEIAVPSLNLNFTGKGTESFYHLSLINRDNDFHGMAGIAYDILILGTVTAAFLTGWALTG
jgi:hypothetical protein